ncbi:MAG: hypothetical protein HBSAPP03_05570 [Phycisphaerae bacterium]|nr:MAG: hypothetical protein HBSAPP03_05570 [Phycisphaerae bacterium]
MPRRRVYEKLRALVEDAGGTMEHERRGHGPGGAWIVTLRRKRSVFESNGAGFPRLDRLYVPKVPNPSQWRDYTNTLRPGARAAWMRMIG